MPSEIFGCKAPKKACTDQKCPFHGSLNVKKEIYSKGIVVKKDTHHTATVEWKRSFYVPKYERYEMRKSRLRVHNPPCLDAQPGQAVIVAKTRPLSKTKHHVIIHIPKEKRAEPSESKEKKEKAKKAEGIISEDKEKTPENKENKENKENMERMKEDESR